MALSPETAAKVQQFFTTLPPEGIQFRGQPQRNRKEPQRDGIDSVRKDGKIWSFLIRPDDEHIQTAVAKQDWDALFDRLHRSMIIGITRATLGPIRKTEIVVFKGNRDTVVDKKYYESIVNGELINTGRYFLMVTEQDHVPAERVLHVTRRARGQDDIELRVAAIRAILNTTVQ